MSLDKFRVDPWATSHAAYESSVFQIRPAPEFATAEVALASLYRASGFEQAPESGVPTAGREFDKASQSRKIHDRTGSKISLDCWRSVLHGILESPKQPNQSSKRFLQLCPVVPDAALYSGSARLAGNSWKPGALVQRMIQVGTESSAAALALWERLHRALTVSDEDDIWARWLESEFILRRASSQVKWEATRLPNGPEMPGNDKAHVEFPAKQFAKDLQAIIDVKLRMTRRQWVSLLEAVIRLATVAHVLWLSDVNDALWIAIRNVLNGNPPPRAQEIRREIISCDRRILTYGNPALPIIRDYASGYLSARLGINFVLWHLDAMGTRVTELSSSSDLERLLTLVSERRAELCSADVVSGVTSMQEDHARTIACKKGIGSNLVEFARHVLGQRQTANESLRGYDQGYFLRKRGEHLSAPWVVSFGPVAVLAIVHCCLRDAAGPRSIQRLCRHLEWYGIEVGRDDIAKSDLGRKLRMLGMILDSPDAESGMLLVPPFGATLQSEVVLP